MGTDIWGCVGGSDSVGGLLEMVGLDQLPGRPPPPKLSGAKGRSPPAETVLKAEVLFNAEVMSKAEFASVSECAPPFQYEMPVKPEAHPVSVTPPSEGVPRAGLPAQREDLSRAETTESESSLGSDESSALEGPSTPEAFSGLQEPSNLELCPVPAAEAKSKFFLDELSQEALLGEDPFLQEEGPPLMPLELFPALQDPFAEVEAKLARLSSTVAQADAPQEDVPKVPMQVASATQDARRERSRQLAGRRGPWAHREGQLQLPPILSVMVAPGQGSGREAWCRALYMGREVGVQIPGSARHLLC